MRKQILLDLQNNLLEKEKIINTLKKEKQKAIAQHEETKNQNLTFKKQLLDLQQQVDFLKEKLIDLQKEITQETQTKTQQTKKKPRRGTSKQASILKKEIQNGNT